MGKRPSRLVWIDTETTGLDTSKCGIIEIAIVKTPLDASEALEKFHAKIKLDPENTRVEPDALKMNHYSEEDWKDALPIEAALDAITRICVFGTQLAGHNVGYDRDIIRGAFDRAKRKPPSFFSELVDTVNLSYPLYVQGLVDNLKLGTVAGYFNIEQKAAHSALDDLRTSCQIYRRILKLYPVAPVI